MATKSNLINLPKSVKLIAATIIDRAQRTTYVKAMIDAEQSFIASKNRKFSDPATSQRSREALKD